MPRVSTKFDVAGLAPGRDWAWLMAGEAVHREFWREVVRLGKLAKGRELKAGIDRYGRAFAPLKPYTIEHRKSDMGEADPNAPPLIPAHGLSRTNAYFDGRAFPDRAEFFWRNDWGKILHFHRIGAGRLPVRDTIGLAPGSLAFIRAQMAKWWAAKRREITAGIKAEDMAFTPPAAQAATKPVPPPPKIRKVGSFDFDRLAVPVDDRTRRAAEAGYFTGFRQFGGGGLRFVNPRPAPPDGGRPATNATRRAAMAPRPAAQRGKPPLTPLPEAVQGLRFAPPDKPGLKTVMVSVAKVDAALRADPGYYVGPGGTGAAIGGRYDEVARFAARAKARGIPFEQSVLVLGGDGLVSFRDGRHRFAWLRDQGMTVVPVSVPARQAAATKRRYGG